MTQKMPRSKKKSFLETARSLKLKAPADLAGNLDQYLNSSINNEPEPLLPDSSQEELWDKQIEADAKAGRLDKIIAEATKEHQAGLSKPL